MRDKQCDVIRRELEELTLNEEFSVAASEHMRTCADCREFQRQQTKLRQIVGSLGTVNAPADFDFRLRARLAADSGRSSFRYWSIAVKGLATAAVLVVFGVGAVMVWQRIQEDNSTVAVAPPQAEPRHEQPRQPEPVRRDEPTLANVREGASIPSNLIPRRNSGRPSGHKSKQPVASFAISSQRANVVPVGQPALDTATVFPIETSLQSVKVSLDDGRGNARTISFPTVSFGSQRVLATGNQIAPKHVW